jgi:hypothetical protein
MGTGSRSWLAVLAFAVMVLLPAGLATQAAPDVVILRGTTFGGVKFAHLDHVDRASCVTCHHESRPQLPVTSEAAKCTACHKEAVEPPLVTDARTAFHDRRAREGLCVGCHVTQASAGRATPVKCSDCHKPENQ